MSLSGRAIAVTGASRGIGRATAAADLQVAGEARDILEGNVESDDAFAFLAVAKGQSEAGLAVGLKRGQLLRMIVLPQAFRIVLPPIGNQFLNLFKNSSLAIAIGYMDIVATIGGISLMQTGKEMETMIIVLLTYLVISLSTAAFMNWYNDRSKLVER